MNKRTRICIIALAAVLALPVSPALAGKRKMKAIRTIVIDPGHGGENNGALGFNGKYEKEIVLELALTLKERLELATDATVILTRDSDESVPLERRVSAANEAQADLFISLHCNSSFSRTPFGIETYVLSDKALVEETEKLSRGVVKPRGLYASASDGAAAAVVKEMLQYVAQKDAKEFAENVQANMTRRTKAPNRGVKSLPIVVLRGAEMPGVVIEVGFISNPAEADALARPGYRKMLAMSIAQSIIAYDREMGARRRPVAPEKEQAVVGTD
jgi:N-acetylmuramoyl-L-alanine amidase